MFSLLHVRMAVCAVSADTIDGLRTVFLCFTKAGRNFAQLKYFLEYTVRFYIFVKLEEISPKGLINGK